MIGFDGARFASALLLLLVLPVAWAAKDLKPSWKRQAYAIVQPVEGKTKLAVDPEGLSLLKSIKGPVSPIVVIGPYRSGKSFLLNQLLGVGCDEGFGVGHSRATQTRGIWVWGEPQPVASGGKEQLAMIYVDTEGFESTGKADAYDDRIFALSTLISSVLIYNLPETVRESDIEKLSFAVQLADGFYAQTQNETAPVQPANMLWLIQRDFLQGKTVQQMVHEALLPVPNPNADRDIEQVNKIRRSLRVIAKNSTAYGLAQPHLDRTALCRLRDDELDPKYIQQRAALQELVRGLAKPKVIAGEVLNGAGLAFLVEQMVDALNARDIPTAGSILEHFNKDLVYRVEAGYVKAIEAVKLPLTEREFLQHHKDALAAALVHFDLERFGNERSSEMRTLREMLEAGINKEWEARKNKNSLESVRICERLETSCEDLLEREQRVALPSTGRFTARYERCLAGFERECIGPGRTAQAERLEKAWRRENTRFRQDYNDKLFNGLVMVMLIDILIFRFIIKLGIMESLGWLGFIFLQVYPKMYLGGGSMYDSQWWQGLVQGWEILVYYPLLDQAAMLVFVVYAMYRLYRRYIEPRCQPRRRPVLPIKKNGSGSNLRDMDV